MQVETIKIKSSSPEQGDYVLINKSDFDPEIHALFEPESKPRKTKQTESAE